MVKNRFPAIANDAARLVGWLFSIRRPAPQRLEPGNYTDMPQCYMVLHRVTGLNQEQLAFYLGVSPPTLSKAESGTRGAGLQAPELERAMELAKNCYLPVMVEYIRMEILSRRGKKIKGPSNDPWWKDEENKATPFGFSGRRS